MIARKGFSSARQHLLVPSVLSIARVLSKIISGQQKGILVGLGQAQSESTAANELPFANAVL